MQRNAKIKGKSGRKREGALANINGRVQVGGALVNEAQKLP